MTGKPVFAASEREKVLFPDPAIPVTRTRRPIAQAASLIDVSVPQVPIRAEQLFASTHAGKTPFRRAPFGVPRDTPDHRTTHRTTADRRDLATRNGTSATTPARYGRKPVGDQFHFHPEAYLELVRSEVPAYDRLQDVVAQATIGLDATSILDLGVGTGVTTQRVVTEHPSARLVG